MIHINLSMPSNWNRLTRKQLLMICRLFLAKLDYEEFRLRAFLRLTGVKALPKKVINNQEDHWLFKIGKQKFTLGRQELTWFLKSTDYLTRDSQLTINHFPSFRLLFKRFFGPSSSCYNLTYFEFLHAEKCLYAFQRTDDTKHLNQLCAILYRPSKENYQPKHPDHDGDRREQFNDFIYPKRAWRFRLLNSRKRMAIYLFYTGCRNVMINSFPNLFNSGAVSSEPVNPVKSLKNIIFDLNQGDPTKNEKLYKMQVWEAFEFLDGMIERTPKPKKHGKV